jgi:hypothetical protein
MKGGLTHGQWVVYTTAADNSLNPKTRSGKFIAIPSWGYGIVVDHNVFINDLYDCIAWRGCSSRLSPLASILQPLHDVTKIQRDDLVALQ